MPSSHLMRNWRRRRKQVQKWIDSDRVKEEHTATDHRYRDTLTDILYTESVTRLIDITNTEGYAQKNARQIITQIKAEYTTYTPDTVEARLCAAMHVSSDKLEANELGTEVHRLLDLWCQYLIAEIDRTSNPFPPVPDITEWAKQHGKQGPAWLGETLIDAKVVAALMSFEKWRIEKNVVPIATEIPLISATLCTGGKGDLLCYYGRDVCLVDYKTGQLKAAHWLQQAAYYVMLRQCTRIVPRRIQLWQPNLKYPGYKEEWVKPIGVTVDIMNTMIRAHHKLAELKSLRKEA